MPSSRVKYAPDGRSRTLLEEELILSSLRFHELVSEALQHALRDYDITGQQLNVLRILYVRGEPVPTGLIAERLLSRVPDVPRLIDRLEKRGLVERRACKEDRRRTMVALTKAGERLVAKIDEPLLESIEALFAHFPQKKIEKLKELLDEARTAVLAAHATETPPNKTSAR